MQLLNTVAALFSSCLLLCCRGVLCGEDTKCGSRAIKWRPTRDGRIIGGQVPPVGAIPWQVALLSSDGKHHCGGALINNRLVLSAAHCFGEELKAVAGGHGPRGTSPHEQVLRVDKFIPHPDWRKLGAYSYDLALLEVSSPGFQMNDHARPACFSEDSAPPGTWCEVSGWGYYDPDVEISSPILKAAAVPVIPLDTCRKSDIYGGRKQQILDTMLCAGHLKGGIDSCRGDSGGPLVCERNGRLELNGIVSWGVGCAKKNKPGVYTRVSSFLPWIKEVAMKLGYQI